MFGAVSKRVAMLVISRRTRVDARVASQGASPMNTASWRAVRGGDVAVAGCTGSADTTSKSGSKNERCSPA